MGVNYALKSFMKLTQVGNFIKLFGHNLCCFWHITLYFDLGYAVMSVNYALKVFMKLTEVANFLNYLGIIDAAFGLLTFILTEVTLLWCKLCFKKFYEIDTSGQFHKTFLT
jgi:hypothetical protein